MPVTTDRPVVLFVCSRNRGKSQMAAALLRQLAGEEVEVHSAGTVVTGPAGQPDSLNQESVASLQEVGASVQGEHPKPVDPDVLRRADRVVVLGREAHVEPVEGMRTEVETWVTDEPSDRGIEGMERMRLVRDDIDRRVRALAAELGVAGHR